MLAVYLSVIVLLFLINAFFALAEFAAVKIRPTRVDELAEAGDRRAIALRHVKGRIDEYLSVCQVGVTLASVGLGFVGEPVVARALQPFFASAGPQLSLGISIALTYLVLTYASIVLAELVPKSIALRATERAALAMARPLRACYALFYVPLVVLHRSADGLLRILGFPRQEGGEALSEEELRSVLAASQGGAGLSFQQLLRIENVLDAGQLKVRDAMRPRAQARALRLDAPFAENLKVVTDAKFSRYPLIEPGRELPSRLLHVKDLVLSGGEDLAALARPLVSVREDAPLQELLSELQRKRAHLAAVTDAKGAWTGLISFEDVIEEFIGAVEDEFEREPALSLADALSPGRIVPDLKATSMEAAIRGALEAVPAGELPLPGPTLAAALLERERRFSTYLGRGLAIPHARLEGLEKPALILARSPEGVPVEGREDRAKLLFILLTPSRASHLQVRLLARIAGLLDSEFVEKRLYAAGTSTEILDAVRAGELAASGS